MKHNKLKIDKVEDKGMTKRDYFELAVLTIVLVLAGSLVLAFFVAALKIITEQL